MKIKVLVDAQAAAREAATGIAAVARAAIRERGRFVLAVSGGQTPWQMLPVAGGPEVPWDRVHLVQVDERLAPAGDPDRNLTHLQESLLSRVSLPPGQISRHAGGGRGPGRGCGPGTPRLSGRSPARRRCSTWSIWAWARMATPPLCYPEIRS